MRRPAASSPRRPLAARTTRRRAQLGLPLLLAARRHLHPARADERGLLRRSAGLARLAAARRRRAARRRCRSCTASRGERRLAECEVPWLPRIRRLEASARSAMPPPTNSSSMSTAKSWTRSSCRSSAVSRTVTAQLVASSARCSSTSKPSLARARRRHLGSARRTPAIHPFEGDGVGRIRPRHQDCRARSGWRPARRWRRSAPRSTRRSASGLRLANSAASSSPTARSARCSLLLIPLVGFLPLDDPRVLGTVDAIERKPAARRPRAALRHCAKSRTACRRRGRVPRLQLLARRRLFLRTPRRSARTVRAVAGLRNDVGLLAEEYDTDAKRMVGNFPQAFSHIALINTAHNVAHATTKPCEQRSGSARLARAAE